MKNIFARFKEKWLPAPTHCYSCRRQIKRAKACELRIAYFVPDIVGGPLQEKQDTFLFCPSCAKEHFDLLVKVIKPKI